MARVRSAKIARELADEPDPADAIAEGLLRTVEAIRGEWWYQALEGHGATAAVARIGGGPQAFTEIATPLVTPFLDRLSASGQMRSDITAAEATEWLVVVTVGLLTMELPAARHRAEHAHFLRQFVAYSLLAGAGRAKLTWAFFNAVDGFGGLHLRHGTLSSGFWLHAVERHL